MTLTTLLLAAAAAAPFDLVIAGGRVIDPETNLDAVRWVGVKGGRIEAVSDTPLKGKLTIKAAGLVVAPGFIDVHSHALNVPSNWMQAFDGVTTALELELGAWPVADAYAKAQAEGRPLNYGYSVSWKDARRTVAGAAAEGLIPEARSAEVVELIGRGLDEGAVGIGLPIGHQPDTNRAEYYEIGRLAARRGATTFTHARTKNTHEPKGAVEGFEEVVAVGAATGARMHICHVNSTALRDIGRIAGMIGGAQSRGIAITTEAYPWGAGSTRINAPYIRPENLALVDLEPRDIEVVATGERPKDAARLAELQKADPTQLVIIHYLDEADPADEAILMQAALMPDGLIASDAIPYTVGNAVLTDPVWPLPAEARAHPRIAATFTTVLGRWVRERQALTLNEAIRRSTLLPARLIEPMVPAMKLKGRLQPGADADIVVFDPATVGARATYADPRRPAQGMRQVIVNGAFVVRDGKLVRDARPGRPIRAAVAGP